VISKKYNKEYGRIKIGLDSMLTAIAIVGSWLLYKKVGSLRDRYNNFCPFGRQDNFQAKGIKGLKRLYRPGNWPKAKQSSLYTNETYSIKRKEMFIGLDLPQAISLLYRKMNTELNERLGKIGLSKAKIKGYLDTFTSMGRMAQIDA